MYPQMAMQLRSSKTLSNRARMHAALFALNQDQFLKLACLLSQASIPYSHRFCVKVRKKFSMVSGCLKYLGQSGEADCCYRSFAPHSNMDDSGPSDGQVHSGSTKDTQFDTSGNELGA